MAHSKFPLAQSKFLITAFCLLQTLAAFSQDVFLDKLGSSLSQHEAREQKEKIYVQTDKSFYIAGEIMWFKSWLVDAALNRPFALSKVAYVELLNRDSRAVLQGKIGLQDGTGNGSFFLPLSLPSGSYKIRAYTNWMKNFGSEYFFEKDITVINTLKRDRDTAAARVASYDVSFFPEGGNLIEGIPSVIGFKAVDGNGNGVSVEGDIVDNDKKPIAHFQSQLFGLGHFTMTASPNQKYTAYVRVGQSQLTTTAFPAALPKGYSLQLTTSADQLLVHVSGNYDQDSRPLYVVVQTRGLLKYGQALTLQNGKAELSIKKSATGEGVSVITLFNANQQPVAERLVFNMPAGLDVSAQSEMEEYQTRKKISAYIRVNNTPGDSSVASLGLSVYRIDSVQQDAGPDIRSYLYLGSDIKGNIEHAEYYFTHTGTAVETGLDNLMLTQGWRRFNWQDVMQSRSAAFEYIPEWNGHLVHGKITDRTNGQPLNNRMVYLAGPGVNSQLAGANSNSKGQLLYDLTHLAGSSVLVMQTENRKDSMYRLDILSPFSEKPVSDSFPAFVLKEQYKKELAFYNLGTQVQNVYLLNDLIRFTAPRSFDSTSFYGEPDKKFFLDDYTRFGTMEEVVREYIEGVSVRKRQGKFIFRMLNTPLKDYFDQDPLIVLDGVPIFDADEVMALNPLRIKKIEIVNRKYFQGSLVASGIFALYSYNNDMAGMQLNSHALILEYEGLQLQREFYSPKYEKPDAAGKRMPDFRNLLTWNPDIVTGKNGQAKVEFYSSDRKGRYMGVVEGLNQNGKAGSAKFFFEVQ